MTGARRLLVACGMLGSLGCLRAFGPDLRARDHHAGLAQAAAVGSCMDCHVSEPEAIAMGVDEHHPAPAPIVAPWMIEDERECVVCHRVWTREDETRTAWHLAPAYHLAPRVATDDDAR